MLLEVCGSVKFSSLVLKASSHSQTLTLIDGMTCGVCFSLPKLALVHGVTLPSPRDSWEQLQQTLMPE